MRICYLASPGVHSNRWLEYFADKGHKVHLITAVREADTGSDNVKIHQLKRFGPKARVLNYVLNSISLLSQFKRLIKEINPDIIHAHNIDDQKLLGAFSGFHPFIVTAWGSDVLVAPRNSRISRWIVKQVIKRADLLTCDAAHIRDALVKLGADPARIHRILFGVDVGKFKPGDKDNQLAERLGIQDSPTVISIRYFEPLYNIETLVTAMAAVIKEIPRAKLLLLGRGSQESQLKELSQSLGISRSVIFAGLVPAYDVPRYLNLADICVSTSLSDAGPGGIIEAMGCELPVITTDIGENRHWVEDGVNGFIIPLKSPQALAAKIIYLLKNPDAMREFGKINRRIIVERNNWEKEMGKMEKLYQEIAMKYRK